MRAGLSSSSHLPRENEGMRVLVVEDEAKMAGLLSAA